MFDCSLLENDAALSWHMRPGMSDELPAESGEPAYDQQAGRCCVSPTPLQLQIGGRMESAVLIAEETPSHAARSGWIAFRPARKEMGHCSALWEGGRSPAT